jgi:hypothetical protein
MEERERERERERSVLRWRDMRGKKIEKKKTNNATCRR